MKWSERNLSLENTYGREIESTTKDYVDELEIKHKRIIEIFL